MYKIDVKEYLLKTWSYQQIRCVGKIWFENVSHIDLHIGVGDTNI